MARTILDYIVEKKVKSVDKKLVAEYLELMHRLTLRSSEAFMKLYDMVTSSSDKRLKKEAQRLFGKTVVEIVASLHELNKIEKQLFGDKTSRKKRRRRKQDPLITDIDYEIIPRNPYKD